ncbi:methylmalonyl-CoA mutase family protein [Streptomyces sp. NPDC056491]|uniref:methylmalonyl-CoA mutase family protein n=1 Tax=Streptomyces sp. NPDC056491 TaxID=3345837 RepID=UPI0036B03648
MPLTVVRSNNRYEQLVARGATSLSVHFDLPTRRGHDSDTPAAAGHVGGTGVAVDSIDDMRVLLAGIPLEQISLSMSADAAVAQMVLLYQLAAEEQGIATHLLRGTAARRLRVFPPGPSGRLDADLDAAGRVGRRQRHVSDEGGPGCRGHNRGGPQRAAQGLGRPRTRGRRPGGPHSVVPRPSGASARATRPQAKAVQRADSWPERGNGP